MTKDRDLVGVTESCSTPHPRGRRYKKLKLTYLNTQSLVTRGGYLYIAAPIHFHNKVLTQRKSILTERETNPNILTNFERYILL
jgi:hypothetical protein